MCVSCLKKGQKSNAACAVQFRMGGCKGVLAVDPRLGKDEKIVIRPSMEKFKCNEYELETVTFSRPRKICIVLLSALFRYVHKDRGKTSL